MWIGHRQFQKEKARYLSAKLFIENYLFRSIYYLISHLISRFSTCRIPYRRTSGRVQWRQNSWEKKAVPTLCCETNHLSLHPTAGPWGRPSSHQVSCAVVPHHLPEGTNSLDKILTMWSCCWPEVLTGVIETRKLNGRYNESELAHSQVRKRNNNNKTPPKFEELGSSFN